MDDFKLGPAERVYLKLKNAVVLQNFDIGERLMINDLADRYFVSSTPVREALSRLHGEELIDFHYGHGYFCKTPSLQELENLYELLNVVLTSCTIKSERNTVESSQLNTVPAAGVTVRDTSDKLHPDDKKSIRIQRLVERIVQMSGNEMTLNLVKNIHARTHFMLRRAFSDECSSAQMDDLMGSLLSALESEDPTLLVLEIESYLFIIRQQLPTLLRNFVAERYFVRH